LREEKSQRLNLGVGTESNLNEKKSTSHFGRVGYGRIPCVDFTLGEDTRRPRIEIPSGFGSLMEPAFILLLIWFFVSVV
jgi:hypothetical protein